MIDMQDKRVKYKQVQELLQKQFRIEYFGQLR